MSLVPAPGTPGPRPRRAPAHQAPPLPAPEQMIRPRNVRGNVSGSWGHVMRPPGSDWLRRQHEDRQHSAGDELWQATDDMRRQKRSELAMEFEESTRGKILHGQAKALAAASMRAVQLDLNRRRDQLRTQLKLEGVRAEQELSDQAARAAVDRLEAARLEAGRLKQRAEEVRRQEVARAREKQDRERIEPLRQAERAFLTLACKEINAGQMRDRQEQLEARREEERLHHGLHLKTLQSQMSREEQHAREELARKKALCDTLQRQVELQHRQRDLARQEEMADGVERLHRLREELHQERLAEMERRRKQRQDLQQLFQEQIKQRQRALAEQADKEAAVDEDAARRARHEEARQQQSSEQNKSDAASELRMFMSHVAAVRRQQEQADQEEQRLREEHAAELQRQQDERWCRVRAARQRILQDTLTGRRQQLDEARAARERRAKEEAEEKRRLAECRDQNLALSADLQRRMAEHRKQYADDLRQQMKYQQLLKNRRAEEAHLETKRCEKNEAEYQSRVQELLNNPVKYATHPFRLKIEGKALVWPE